MKNKTVLDDLVRRLAQIAEAVDQRPEHQDDLDQEISDVSILLSGLEKITDLLTDTFNAIDTTLLRLRMNQEVNRDLLRDSLATVSTVLINYSEFVKFDGRTIRLFLDNVDLETLQTVLVDVEPEVTSGWHAALSKVLALRSDDDDITKAS